VIVYAVIEAKRLGLESGLVASSSWNAGGDWVTTEFATIAVPNDSSGNSIADKSGVVDLTELLFFKAGSFITEL
jgi:hypothetical protein